VGAGPERGEGCGVAFTQQFGAALQRAFTYGKAAPADTFRRTLTLAHEPARVRLFHAGILDVF
jgi:hypothetical protein